MKQGETSRDVTRQRETLADIMDPMRLYEREHDTETIGDIMRLYETS